MKNLATQRLDRSRTSLRFESLEKRDLLSVSPVLAPFSESYAEVSALSPANATEEFRLTPLGKSDTAVVLHNESNFKARFTMKFNGNISVNVQDLVEQIRSMEIPGDEDIPDHEKAYHYLIKYHEHDFPLSGRTWMHEPSLYLNSIGAGLCDDAATALSLIWKAMGYESRIWLLQGHVVSEVLVGDRWQLYDADLQVMYFNRDGQVAGLEELAAQPDLITAPTTPMNSDQFVYTDRMASFYASAENNRPCTACADYTVGRDLVFEIPAGGTMEWGETIIDKQLPAVHLSGLTKVGQIKVTIPAGSIGTLDIPLALYDVRGADSDRATIAGRSMRLGTDDTFNFIHTETLPGNRLQTISFSNNDSPIEVLYFFNRKFAVVQSENLVEVQQRTASSAILRAGFVEPVAESWRLGSADAGANGSAAFNGSQYVDVSNSSTRLLFAGDRDFEVSARIRPDSSSATRRPIVDANRFSFEIDAENRAYAYFRADNDRWVGVRGPVLSGNQWHDLSVSYVGGRISLSVNGTLVAVRTGSRMDARYPMLGLSIGRSKHMGGLYYRGRMHEVSIRELATTDTPTEFKVTKVKTLQQSSFRAARNSLAAQLPTAGQTSVQSATAVLSLFRTDY